jgi:spermidine/putrescine-binding protein
MRNAIKVVNYPEFLCGGSPVIFKNSEHKEEVWKFIEFLSEPSTQIKFYNLLYNLPAVKEAWEDSSIANNIYTKAFYEQFNNVVATPKIPEWEQIAFSKVQQYAELAARDAMSIDEALQNWTKMNQTFERRFTALKMNRKEKKKIKNSYSFATTAAYFLLHLLIAILIFFHSCYCRFVSVSLTLIFML